MAGPHTAGLPFRALRLGLAIASPRAVALAVIVLICEWWFVPGALPGPTIFASTLTSRAPAPFPSGPVATIYLVRDDADAWRAVDDAMSGDAIAPALTETPDRVVLATFSHERHVAGIWGPWLEHEASHLKLQPLVGGEVPEPGPAPLRAAFADWFRSRGSPTYAALALQGGHKSSHLVWWGPLVDIAALGAMLVILLGLTRLALTRIYLGRCRSLAAGFCPRCRYDLRGVVLGDDGTGICPECGFRFATQEPV
ncbi:MAG: hypothetical protein IT433_12680 [Phycisphaerales bacterium]|nr:hypothetical protein [Phycisphaerales bacterium]